MKKQQTHKSMGNPVAATTVAAYAANNPRAVKKAIGVGAFLVGLAVVGVGGFAFYKFYWKNRFKKIKFNTAYAPSSVTPSQAKLKADMLYRAMHGFGRNFDAIYEAFKGVNYNGFVEIYNAFGKRRPADSLSFGNSGDLTLTEWLRSDLWESELEKLRNLTKINGLF